MASKPYAASANYINNMSDYCKGCVYNPKHRTGDDACPFNVFYWDFLARHYPKLQNNDRMKQILFNLHRLSAEELAQIQQQAADWRIDHQHTEYPLPCTPNLPQPHDRSAPASQPLS